MPDERIAARGLSATTWALGALVGLIVVLPALRFRWTAGGAYEGVSFLGSADGEFYVTQVRQIADGTFGRRNDLLHEWSQGEPVHRTPLGAHILALGYRPVHAVLGTSLHAFVAGVTFVAAALQFVLLRRIASALGLRPLGAVTTALACCLVPFLWSFDGATFWVARTSTLVTTDFLPLWRPVNPSVSSTFLWAALAALVEWISRPRAGPWLVVTAVAAFAYDLYPATFTVVGGLLAAAAVVLFLRGRRRHGLWIVASGAVALACTLPRLAWAFRGTGDAASDEANLGGLFGVPCSTPIVTADTLTLLALAAVALALHLRRRLDDTALLLAVGAPVAMLLLFNQHLVTGRVHQPFHYDWFYSVPLAWLALGAVLVRLRPAVDRVADWTRRPGRARLVAAVAGVVVVLAAGAAFGGTPGAAILRGCGLIRGDSVARPWLVVGLAAVAAAVLSSCAELLRRRGAGALGAAACAIAAVACIAEGLRIQDRGFERHVDETLAWQRVAPAIRWMQEHAEPGSVLACARTGEIPRLFTSRADVRVLVSLETMYSSFPPEEEYRERHLVRFALFGVPRDLLARELADNGRWHSDVFKWRAFGELPRHLKFVAGGADPPRLDPGDLDRVLGVYDRVLSMTPAERLARFRIDYVLWTDLDPEHGFSDPARGHPLQTVLDAPGCRLYRVPRGR